MSEPKRLEPLPAPEAAERDSRAEALLVEGLDRYFDGRYEEAIHVWTRVLFLDRSHARARAYIDRARTALAERQRRAEELLDAAAELVAEGQTDRARALLAQLEATSGDDPHIAALRTQLERVERARLPSAWPKPPAARRDKGTATGRRGALSTLLTSALVAGSAAVVVLAIVLVVQLAVGRGGAGQQLPAATRMEPLRVLSTAEVALVRARTLYARGRLAEALVVLDRVAAGHPQRVEADRLRIEIQHALLGGDRGSRTVPGAGRGVE